MSISRLFIGPACDPSSIYYDSDACGWGSLAAFVIGFFAIILIFCLITITFEIIARWIFFKKCGEAGWKAIIPVYNELTLLKVAGMNWWWIFFIYASSILSIFNSTISSLAQSYESIGLSLVSLFFSLIVFAASVFTIITKIGSAINIAKRFHKSGGYAVLIIFFEPIMFLILGLSKDAVYDKKVKVSQNGIFGPKQSN